MTDIENPGALAGATGARDTNADAGAPENSRSTRAEQAPGFMGAIRKNAKEELRVSLEEFKGHRLWYEAEDGTRHPGKQGLAIRQELLPELLKALHKAEREAGL